MNKKGFISDLALADWIGWILWAIVLISMIFIAQFQGYGNQNKFYAYQADKEIFPLLFIEGEHNGRPISEHLVDISKTCNDRLFNEIFSESLAMHPIYQRRARDGSFEGGRVWALEKNGKELCVPEDIPKDKTLVDAVHYIFPDHDTQPMKLTIAFYHTYK